jgi:3-oxoacyl-[acyl-carrier protein] reductase
MTINQSSKVVLITGASKGIGASLAKKYCQDGWLVVGCGRSNPAFESEGFTYSHVDVSLESEVQSWVRATRKQFGKVDVLICCAGSVQSSLPMMVTPADVLESFLDSHVKGTFFVCREVSKIMTRARYGRIINFSSLSVPLLLEGTSAYTATKSAVVDMTKVLAKELAPLGITCNVVGPSLISTEVTKQFTASWRTELLEKHTLKTPFDVSDIYYIIQFLTGSRSHCITGQVINMGLVS